MKRLSWKLKIAFVLLGSTVVLGIIHLLLFRDAHDLFFYILLDIVFVPVQVLLVTIILEEFLSQREKESMMKKLNMVIGAFFSEVGSALIRTIYKFCTNKQDLSEHFNIKPDWEVKEYSKAAEFAEKFDYRLEPDISQLKELKAFLTSRRLFILGLLQNPNLLEHEKFTDLLWAVTHLDEELEARVDLESLPASDLAHLNNDTVRALRNLCREWLAYMQHLKSAYPYMYSLSMRLNPFNPASSAVVKQ